MATCKNKCGDGGRIRGKPHVGKQRKRGAINKAIIKIITRKEEEKRRNGQTRPSVDVS